MAIITQLNPTALPGKRYSFLPKTPASGTHTGLFTQLSVIALPGGRHTFLAKTPAVAGHTGEFTGLSAYAVPGMRHYFSAKTPEEIPPGGGGGGGSYMWHMAGINRALRDDEDFLQILAAITPIITRS